MCEKMEGMCLYNCVCTVVARRVSQHSGSRGKSACNACAKSMLCSPLQLQAMEEVDRSKLTPEQRSAQPRIFKPEQLVPKYGDEARDRRLYNLFVGFDRCDSKQRQLPPEYLLW